MASMNLIALTPVRNEDWILGLSLRVALMYCDSIVVLDHASTDRTPEILREISAEHPGRVTILTEPDPKWDEMRHRQRMLEVARGLKATHIYLADCDEILSGNLLPVIRHRIEKIPRRGIMELPGYNLRGSINCYHTNGTWGNRWFSTAFADDKRLHWGGDKFHHRAPEGATLIPHRPIAQGAGGVMHLWAVSERRLRAKHVAYRLHENLRWPHKAKAEIERYYSLATDGTGRWGDSPKEWAFASVPEAWWAPYAHLMRCLDVDAVPWQEAECERLIAEHGRERFRGLRI